MAGFATKLKLISEKFFQPTDGTLELSGKTYIADTGDLRYVSHPTLTGDTQIIDKKYADNIAINADTGITEATVYSLSSPSTVDVGGLNAGSDLTGFTSNELLEKVLVATLYPELTSPSVSSFVVSDGSGNVTGNIYETGLQLTLTSTATFSRGSIDPQYDATSQYRSGLPNTYEYNGTGLPASEASTSLTNTQTITDYAFVNGSNTWQVRVSYDGGVQPYDSKGNTYQTPLPAGTTSYNTVTTNAYYPYFYGTSVSEPIFNQTLIDNGTKIVNDSDNTVSVTYPTDVLYQWLAIPSTSTAKEGYYFSEFNKGNIGTEENLFGPEQSGSIDSPEGHWTGIQYRFYVTTYASEFTSQIQFRNNPQQ